MAEECGCCRKRARTEEEYKAMLNRLKRIEGQVRGLEKMVENECWCPDILTQVSAVNCALNSFSKELLSQHLKTCVADGIREGNTEILDELVETLRKVMK